MLQLKNVSQNKKDFNKIKELYYEAFPREEVLPLFLLRIKAKKENIDFLGIYDESQLIGLIYVVTYKDISCIMYFAITENVRGKGYGSKVLDLIKGKYKGNRIILYIEEIDKNVSNYEQRVKRKKFYEKNGFKDLQYKIREAGIYYEMLGYEGIVTKEEYEELMEKFLGKLVLFFIKIVL